MFNNRPNSKKCGLAEVQTEIVVSFGTRTVSVPDTLPILVEGTQINSPTYHRVEQSFDITSRTANLACRRTVSLGKTIETSGAKTEAKAIKQVHAEATSELCGACPYYKMNELEATKYDIEVAEAQELLELKNQAIRELTDQAAGELGPFTQELPPSPQN